MHSKVSPCLDTADAPALKKRISELEEETAHLREDNQKLVRTFPDLPVSRLTLESSTRQVQGEGKPGKIMS